MTDITGWTTKYTGIGEIEANGHPVIIQEFKDVARKASKTWLIGTFREENEAKIARKKLIELVVTGQPTPPLTEAEIERLKTQIAGSNQSTV